MHFNFQSVKFATNSPISLFSYGGHVSRAELCAKAPPGSKSRKMCSHFERELETFPFSAARSVVYMVILSQ